MYSSKINFSIQTTKFNNLQSPVSLMKEIKASVLALVLEETRISPSHCQVRSLEHNSPSLPWSYLELPLDLLSDPIELPGQRSKFQETDPKAIFVSPFCPLGNLVLDFKSCSRFLGKLPSALTRGFLDLFSVKMLDSSSVGSLE